MKKSIVLLMAVTVSMAACKKGDQPPPAPAQPVAPKSSAIEGNIAFTQGQFLLADDGTILVADAQTQDTLGKYGQTGQKARLEGKSVKCTPNESSDPAAKCFQVTSVSPAGQAQAGQGAPQAQAPAQQKIVFTVKSIAAKAYTGEARCQSLCAGMNEDVNTYLGSGWKVVSSTPMKKPGDNDCTCDGVEYVLSNK